MKKLKLTLTVFFLFTTASHAEPTDDDLMVSYIPIILDGITIIFPGGSGLPPNPVNDETLEGVDSDGDDIRDDVERVISMRYPNSPQARMHSALMAMNYQKILESPVVNQVTDAYLDNVLIQQACLEGMTDLDGINGSRFVLPAVLNNFERSRAYIEYIDNYGGKPIPSFPNCN